MLLWFSLSLVQLEVLVAVCRMELVFFFFYRPVFMLAIDTIFFLKLDWNW